MDTNKRTLLKGGFGAIALAAIARPIGLAQTVWADEATPDKPSLPSIPYRASELGINYHELAPSPLAEMLSQGEAEWLKNASAKYGAKAGPLWKRSISKTLAAGTPSESTIEKIKKFTPEMLRSFSRLDHRDPTYGGLSAAGSLFISEHFIAKS